MEVLMNSLPDDLQNKIYCSVQSLRKPKVISPDLMDEVSLHSGLLNNILRNTHINYYSMHYHMRYLNISLLAYYFVWVLNDESFDLKSMEGDLITNKISLESFIIHNESQFLNILLLIRKCWLFMSSKERLKMHKQLTSF